MGSKPVRSIFFTFLEPGKKSENFFSRKNRFFFGKNRDFPKNWRFFAEIFLNDFSMDFSSPLQPIAEKSADFSDFLFPDYFSKSKLHYLQYQFIALNFLGFSQFKNV